MTRTSAFRIAIPPYRAAVGPRAAIFAAVQSARRYRGGWGPGDRGVGAGRGSRGDTRGSRHGAAGRDGARAA
jgi:hypothetical protein